VNTNFSSSLVVTGLKCQYADNPIGIDMLNPRLGWLLESVCRAKHQTAYQILVASSIEKLEPFKADLWDTGKVLSDISINIEYYEIYEDMKAWVWHLLSESENHIISYGLGDWCPPGSVRPDKTPVPITSTAYLFYDASIMAKVAKPAGKTADAERFGAIAEATKDAFNKGFFDCEATTESVHGTITSNWRVEEDILELTICIPSNTSAMVYVPVKSDADILESGIPARDADGVTFVGASKNRVVYQVGSGMYKFTCL
jgi:hypothetical protein